MKRTIQITGHEIKELKFGKKHIVLEDRTKFEFFEKKKNGDMTKAYERWQVGGYGVGDSVVAEVAEEERTFTNKENKEITYTRRTILYFVSDEDVMIAPDAPLDMDLSEEDEAKIGIKTATEDEAKYADPLSESEIAEIGRKVNILWDERII